MSPKVTEFLYVTAKYVFQYYRLATSFRLNIDY